MTPAELAKSQGQTVVLTSNEQQARGLRQHLFAEISAAANADGQQPAAVAELSNAWFENILVLPVDQWLVSLWDGHFAPRQVLRPVQLQALARKVVEDSGLLPDTVFQSAAIARQFVQAFEIAARYLMHEPPAQFPMLSAEHSAFLQWRQALQTRLDEQQLLTGGQLASALTKTEGLALPERLVLAHDLVLEPSADAFIQAKVLTAQRLVTPDGHAAAPLRYAASDLASEVDACARWAAQRLTENAQAQLAVVVTDIRRYGAALERALCRHVHPQQWFPAQVEADESLEKPWSQLGAGRLLNHAMAQCARDIFSLAASEFEQVALSRVLLSAHVSAVCPKLDLKCRDKLGHRTTLKRVLSLCDESNDSEPTEHLQAFQRLLDALPSSALPSSWTRHFDDMLRVMGWPNVLENSPDNDHDTQDQAAADQIRRGLSQVMDSLRTLDRQTGPLRLQDILGWLFQLLDEKRFELKRTTPVSLQILSFEDAPGLECDGLWVMGLDSSALPSAPETSPFLPTAWMHAAGVPRVRAEDCLQRDRELLGELLAQPNGIVLSYARQDSEGVQLLPTALLDWSYEPYSCPQVEHFTIDGEWISPSSDEILPLQEDERRNLKGGTGLFKAIAHSPFIAFCQHRLGLSEFPHIREGLDAAQQGTWVHNVLETLWLELSNSQALNALSDVDQKALVTKHVEGELARYEPVIGQQLSAIEKRRLHAVVNDWLDHERLRKQPFEVEGVEQAAEIEIAGLPLNIKSDRVDLVGEGAERYRLIIDYKTGKIEPKNLNVNDFMEPQLPIYALYSGKKVDGVALASLQAGEPSHHVRTAWCASLDGRKRNHGVESPEAWQNELAAWSNVLDALAEQFKQGDIRHNIEHGWGYSEWLSPLLPELMIDEDDT